MSNPKQYGEKLLLNQSPIMVLPELAKKIGLNEAIILQQIHYWLRGAENKNNNYFDGRYWVYNTYEEWGKQFPWWSISTIRRAFKNLEQKKLLIVGNYNKLQIDNTKWYSINYEKLEGMSRPSVQNEQTECSKWTDGPVQNEQTITIDYHRLTTKNTTLVNDPFLRELLNILQDIKNYPLDMGADTGFIQQLLIDYPALDIKEELKKWAIYKLDKPLTSKSNPRSQFRNWCKKAAEWQKKDEDVSKARERQYQSRAYQPWEPPED